VATSNQALEQKMADKLLREDLFYRINTVSIQVPPLRAHREDIPDLINHYVQQITENQRLPFRRFSISSINYLRNRPWPGNVRELINFIHRMLLTTTSQEIEAEETREVMSQSATPLDEVEEKNAWRDFGRPLRSAREGFERDYLEFHLHQTGGNISELARRAELERTHLYRKLKGLGINPKAEKYRQ
jgi:DNA-binding NtrC family response regulator